MYKSFYQHRYQRGGTYYADNAMQGQEIPPEPTNTPQYGGIIVVTYDEDNGEYRRMTNKKIDYEIRTLAEFNRYLDQAAINVVTYANRYNLNYVETGITAVNDDAADAMTAEQLYNTANQDSRQQMFELYSDPEYPNNAIVIILKYKLTPVGGPYGNSASTLLASAPVGTSTTPTTTIPPAPTAEELSSVAMSLFGAGEAPAANTMFGEDGLADIPATGAAPSVAPAFVGVPPSPPQATGAPVGADMFATPPVAAAPVVPATPPVAAAPVVPATPEPAAAPAPASFGYSTPPPRNGTGSSIQYGGKSTQYFYNKYRKYKAKLDALSR